jgi:hypothetical protein
MMLKCKNGRRFKKITESANRVKDLGLAANAADVSNAWIPLSVWSITA